VSPLVAVEKVYASSAMKTCKHTKTCYEIMQARLGLLSEALGWWRSDEKVGFCSGEMEKSWQRLH